MAIQLYSSVKHVTTQLGETTVGTVDERYKKARRWVARWLSGFYHAADGAPNTQHEIHDAHACQYV